MSELTLCIVRYDYPDAQPPSVPDGERDNEGGVVVLARDPLHAARIVQALFGIIQRGVRDGDEPGDTALTVAELPPAKWVDSQ